MSTSRPKGYSEQTAKHVANRVGLTAPRNLSAACTKQAEPSVLGLTCCFGGRGPLGSDDAHFDLSGDGVVDLVDRDAWLALGGAANGFAARYSLGDATLDGTVNASDLNQVGIGWLADHSEWCLGNFDAEGASMQAT